MAVPTDEHGAPAWRFYAGGCLLSIGGEHEIAGEIQPNSMLGSTMRTGPVFTAYDDSRIRYGMIWKRSGMPSASFGAMVKPRGKLTASRL
jgi:hypothetical protein